MSSDGAIGGMNVNVYGGLEMMARGLGRGDPHRTSDIVSVVKVMTDRAYRVAVLPAM